MSDRKPYKSDLSDERWTLIEPVITAWKADHPSPTGHQGRYEMREIVNAILYQGRTGCQWDYLPHDLPPKSAVYYYYFAAWRDDGTDEINDLLRWQVREKAGRVGGSEPGRDRDAERPHGGERARHLDREGRGQEGARTQRGLAVDVLGLVIAVTVLAASAHDNAFDIALLGQVAPIGTIKKALVDQGFEKTVVEHGTTVGIDVEIVERNQTDKGVGFVPQAKSWIVEQTLGILMLFRRLVRDYESRQVLKVQGALGRDRRDSAPPHRPDHSHLARVTAWMTRSRRPR
ncbi:DDE transposase [Streptomyces capoamus]|uniref:DDE transposase n=1 Tax=Streptomyces capoamus TaxID=68183 RepID=A0A919EV27_9ACTN|nr:IS5 family transposase [Streptomyces capoamus]GGW16377.1 DDE transposase [Streptomyces libani subsp. rufus]GHG42689.1 DDE transposase [Streptomyces capoamus]